MENSGYRIASGNVHGTQGEPIRDFWILTLVLLTCEALGASQQPGTGPQPSVTFRAETNFVEVHAIVTDETGAFVRNLTRDDFEILEDVSPRHLRPFL